MQSGEEDELSDDDSILMDDFSPLLSPKMRDLYGSSNAV
jgi:hypothetical protein